MAWFKAKDFCIDPWLVRCHWMPKSRIQRNKAKLLDG
jgi:hypothetical protein